MEIKRCPFCGGMAIVLKDNFQYEQYQVLCPYVKKENAGCGAASGYYDTMKEAIDAWNRRCEPDKVWEDIKAGRGISRETPDARKSRG